MPSVFLSEYVMCSKRQVAPNAERGSLEVRQPVTQDPDRQHYGLQRVGALVSRQVSKLKVANVEVERLVVGLLGHRQNRFQSPASLYPASPRDGRVGCSKARPRATSFRDELPRFCGVCR
jgi:hypothetical protein